MIIRDLPIHEYHADTRYTSHSRIRDFIERGAKYYFQRHIARDLEQEPSDALTFGQAFETLYQQGIEAFRRTYAVKPRGLDGRTKEGRAWLTSAATATILSDEDWGHMGLMLQSLREDLCDKAKRLVSQAEQQVTLRGELSGLAVQARPDWVCLDEIAPYTVDLKTTKNMGDLLQGEDRTGASLARLGYHTQAALASALLAQNGLPHARAYLLVVEKQPSYRAELLDITDHVTWGLASLSRHLPALRRCQESGLWPASSGDVVKLRLPRYAEQDIAAAAAAQ